MGWLGGSVAFFLIWWVVLFAVLPMGVRHPEKPEPGMMPGAPLKPDFKKILMRTTLITLLLWLTVFFLAEYDIVSFSRMAKDLS